MNKRTVIRYEHDLPVVKIHGIEFRVHLNETEFRQVDKPDHRISFLDLIDNGDHTVLLFDARTNTAFKGGWGEALERKDVKMIRLPSFINLDRVGANELIKEKGISDFIMNVKNRREGKQGKGIGR